jgi:hypothetical protein
MRILIAATFLNFLFISCLNASLSIKELPKKVFEADEVITIEWINEGAQPNDLITIDLINDRPEVMIEPFVIISDVLVKQKKYDWKIPRLIKSSGEYHLRVYLKDSQPGMISKDFSIINPNPMRQSTLNLLEPTGSADGKNLESPCLMGEQCYILWDYPEWAETAMPKRIDINLYSGDKLLMVLAVGVPVETKSFLWHVPAISTLNFDNVHVVISASGRKLRSLKPGESYYLASAGYPFRLETRGEREERKLSNTKPIDFTAPGPITMTGESGQKGDSFFDVPRPTYGGINNSNNNNNNNDNNNNNNYNIGTSTSASASKFETNFLATTFIVLFSFCFFTT